MRQSYVASYHKSLAIKNGAGLQECTPVYLEIPLHAYAVCKLLRMQSGW